MIRRFALPCLLFAACAEEPSPSGFTFDYEVPLAADSPWPKFRRDARQQGRSPVRPISESGHAWSFTTGKGIFSSPVIGGDGTIYVGSADQKMYALSPSGELRWSFPTGGIIDSSALLDDRGRLYFGSGDGRFYAVDAKTGEARFSLEADDPAVNDAFIRWFEGNVAIGPSGTLYAPNDNFFVYGIDRDAAAFTMKKRMPDQTWSLPAIDLATGALYLGNNNLLPLLGSNTFALDPRGNELWSARSLGTVAASPLLAGGLVVVGGFDGYVRAYRVESGELAWSFATRDHVYASAALLADDRVVVPSSDGTVYALELATGRKLWAFDTGEPIRSSPAVDGDGNVYLGSGGGRLYVLSASGRLRYSIRLGEGSRNDLNASPALGFDAVVIAGESGEVFSVPYEYCVRGAGRSDPRCTLGPDEPLGGDGVRVDYADPNGELLGAIPDGIEPREPLTFSLSVREAGDTTTALFDSRTMRARLTPTSSVSVIVSGDRRFLTIVPEAPYVPDEDGQVRVELTGDYLVDFERTGLRLEGGRRGGEVRATLSFRPAPPGGDGPALAIPTADGQPSSAIELRRLAVPLPTIMPSYNQIGFDALHFLVIPFEATLGGGLAWVTEALVEEDAVVPDRSGRGVFPIELAYDRGQLYLRAVRGLQLEALNLRLGFEDFRISGRLGADGASDRDASVIAGLVCRSVEFYGDFLRTLGLCNPDTDLLFAAGAVKLVRHPEAAPPSIAVERFGLEGDRLVATMRAPVAPSTAVLHLVLADSTTLAPVALDYGLVTTREEDAGGAVVRVSLPLTGIPSAPLRAYLLADGRRVASTTVAW